MEQILTATKRDLSGKRVAKLRKQGNLPAVLYGHDVAAQSLELSAKDFLKTFRSAGESTLITLSVDGKPQPVLIHDVQRHYLSGQPTHVDFYAVNMNEKLRARIPLHFIGEAAAVKTLGGVLVKNLSEVEVECLPADLPHVFEVDISKLNSFEDVICVSDIQVSDKVKIQAHPDEIVANVIPPRSEEELKALEEKPVEEVAKVEGIVKPEGVEVATAKAEEPGVAEPKKETK